jgi:hypothetical protein
MFTVKTFGGLAAHANPTNPIERAGVDPALLSFYMASGGFPLSIVYNDAVFYFE